MNRLLYLVLLPLILSIFSTSSAQESSLAAAQPEHELLKKFVGDWRFERRSPSRNGEEPEIVGEGTVSAELVGEFFVVARWTGEVYGNEFKAVHSLGYDVEKEKYAGSWIDSIINYRWEVVGNVDEESEELILTSSGPGPAGGTAEFRERNQFHSAHSISIVGEMRKDDGWVNIVNTELTRQPKSDSDQ